MSDFLLTDLPLWIGRFALVCVLLLAVLLIWDHYRDSSHEWWNEY